MSELLAVLLVLFILLLVVTVAGHGMWVLLAWINRGCTRRIRTGRSCIYCTRQTPHNEPRCQWCGKDLSTPQTAELEDIAAVERHLKRLLADGTIQERVFENLLQRVRRHRAKLLAPKPKPRPVPQPQPTPPLESDVVIAEMVEEPRPLPEKPAVPTET